MWSLDTVSVILPELFPIVGAIFSGLFMVFVLVVMYKALRHADFTNLFVSQDDGGGLSLTKFWQNIAYAAATVAFLATNISGKMSGSSIELIWMIYLGTVASNAVMSKWISMRYSQPQSNQRDLDYNRDYSRFPQDRRPRYPSPTSPHPRAGSIADPDG